MILRRLGTAAFVVGLGALPGVAGAQSTPSPWTLDVSAGVVSDYRYRGITLSDEDFAAQGEVTLSHASGFYGDVYVSSIDEYGIGPDGTGADVEFTLTAGWTGEVAGYVIDVGVSSFRYPGGDDVDYVEIPVEVARAIGPVTLRGGLAYAPEQSALGDEDNRYVWTGADFAPYGWPVSLTGSVGYEDGGNAPGGKTDWIAGLRAPVGRLTFGLDYVDSDRSNGTAVASVFARF